jgi:predicted phage baseplate assembly protein
LAPIELLLDVVAVSRGTSVTGEVLGSGNAALGGQSFTLLKSPLTYLASGNGAISTLAVYVDGVEWREVPSFYDQPAGAKVFVVSRSPDQTVTTVTFGDGVEGARLTSGAGNVTANYRYGAGAASPAAGRLTTISQPQPGLASISNPVAVFPGADAQSTGSVRANAPASVFTFGRAISADDYRMVALEAPGVKRATASWTFDGATQRSLVNIYVGDDSAAVAAATAALAGAEDPNRPVSVLAADPVDLGLTCTLVVAADRQNAAVVEAATAAISDPDVGLFSPAHMGIGQRLYRSAVAAALMVPGVVAVQNLAVTWLADGGRFEPLLVRILDEVFDPGEGAFFRLLRNDVAITGVTSNA